MKPHIKYEFHHTGIPTDEIRAGERYSQSAGMYTADNAENRYLKAAARLALHREVSARLHRDRSHEGRDLLEFLLGELREEFDLGELLYKCHGNLPADRMPAFINEFLSPPPRGGQNTATGTTGEPVAPTNGSGLACSKNE